MFPGLSCRSRNIYGDHIIPTKNPGTTNNNSDSNSSSSSDKSSSATIASEQAGTTAETINKQEELYYQYKQAMQDMGLTEEDYKLLMQYFGTSRATQNMIVHSNKTALQNYIKIQRERNRIKNDPTYSGGNSRTTTSLSPITKPGQQDNSILSDTGTGENSALREAQSYKDISSDDMQWLVAYYRGDRSKAENAIQTMDAQKLQDMIAAQKGWADYVDDEKSGDAEMITTVNPQPGFTPTPMVTPSLIPSIELTPGPSWGPEGAPVPNTESEPWSLLRNLRERNQQNSDLIIENAKEENSEQLLLPLDERFNSSSEENTNYFNKDLRELYLKVAEEHNERIANGEVGLTGVYYQDASIQAGLGSYGLSFGAEIGKSYVVNLNEGWVAEYNHFGPSAGWGLSPIAGEYSSGIVYGDCSEPDDYTNGFAQSNAGIITLGKSVATAEGREENEIVQGSDDYIYTGGGFGYSYGFYKLKDVEYYNDNLKEGE